MAKSAASLHDRRWYEENPDSDELHTARKTKPLQSKQEAQLLLW